MGDSSSKKAKDTTTDASVEDNANSTVNSILDGVNDQLDAGGQYYDKSLYAGVSDTTKQSWDDALKAANNQDYADAIDSALGYSKELIGNGGLTSGQSGDIATTRGIADSYKKIYDNASDYQNDPGYATLRKNAGDDALTSISSQFNSNGRFGGGSYAQSAGEGVTNAYAGLDYKAYMDSIDTMLSALSGQQGSTTDAFGMEQQGVDNVSTYSSGLDDLYNASLLPAQTEGAVGSAKDADAQAALLADYDLWDRKTNADKDNLAWATSVLNGTSSSTDDTSSDNSTPWWQSLLSLGSTFAAAAL